jgi:hypothetical protein
MLQMTLHLTRSSRLRTLLLLGLEVLLLRSEKKTILTVSVEDTQRCDFRPFEDKFVFYTPLSFVFPVFHMDLM